MKFLRKNKSEKIILVISDLHLGAGHVVNGQKNILEDFHYDNELIEFFNFYSNDEYSNKSIELIINGDFLDLLAVPYVKYFDDDFWSEEAAIDKMRMILDAHKEVMEALNLFVQKKNKNVIFIIGNHDAEIVFPSLQKMFLEIFDESIRDRVQVLADGVDYYPHPEVLIKHGHEYVIAHNFEPSSVIAESDTGRKYFIPPWGSYYVTRIVNKFKEDREHINAVRPIKKFLINGLIYDTLFTVRFILANIYYFLMVRFIYLFKSGSNFRSLFDILPEELDLFSDYESLAEDFFEVNKEVKVLILGHTHEPIYRAYPNGTYFINTGTWTRMHHMDFNRRNEGVLLTYAQIDLMNGDDNTKKIKDVALHVWKGNQNKPYDDYQAV